LVPDKARRRARGLLRSPATLALGARARNRARPSSDRMRRAPVLASGPDAFRSQDSRSTTLGPSLIMAPRMLPGPAHVDAGSSNPPVGSAPTPARRGSRAARIRRRLGQLAMHVALGILVHQLRSEVYA